ncbi:MAG TPA: COX15/CtaA family protein [Candidatus Dormibacteraeota bacterium]|nr:COX15/CtaA family protein [Candidatus Dormibacteraeota bacterium]
MSAVTLFRRLAAVTALFAYVQIALGGIVRVSGSGLGCPDWPLCHGRPYPPADLHAIIEYSHRAVGSVTGVLIMATVVSAWVVWRARRPAVAWLATASLVGVVGEGLLGAGVVANELASWLVLIHLGVAMVILAFLVATALMSLPPSIGIRDQGLRLLAAISVGATFLLLLTGSTVVASGADTACRSWPLCGSGFTPDFGGVNTWTMLHRGSVLVIGALLVFVLLRAARMPGLRAASIATLAVLALQVAVGAGAAVTDGAFFNGLHVGLATLVWAGVVTTALLTVPRADSETWLSHMAMEKRPA